MTDVILREANKEDLSTLLLFEQALIEAEKPLDEFLGDGNLKYYEIEEMIAADNTYLIVAVHEDKLIGSGYVRIEENKIYHKNPKHGYIGFIYVESSFRGKKISTKILGELKRWASKKELKELRLDVYNTNIPALKSYESFGFNKSLVNMRMNI